MTPATQRIVESLIEHDPLTPVGVNTLLTYILHLRTDRGASYGAMMKALRLAFLHTPLKVNHKP